MSATEFWAGKRVFLTGHTGFKGSWLNLWLEALGARVKGYALPPTTRDSLFNLIRVGGAVESELADIRDLDRLTGSMNRFDPEILIHMAAQPLVRAAYRDPVGTYATNVLGTVNVLEAARSCQSLRAIISVTTDKCYENREWVWGYRECEPLGGRDPYSSSKACAELVSAAYRSSFFDGTAAPALATARAGNVIGGGDWAEERLIPDVIKAFEAGETALIRNPLATRPWQHVLEPLSGYLRLAEALWEEGRDVAEAWNFGPRHEDTRPVQWIVDRMAHLWGNGATWAHDGNSHPHEARHLKLDISKAQERLQWHPRWSLDITLHKIVAWHKALKLGSDMREHCLSEIDSYVVSAARSAGTDHGRPAAPSDVEEARHGAF